jgi:iron complex transport system substrate-binding protein
MQNVLAHDAAWQAVRAVKEGHAFIAPSLPFGWIEEPPSINRLLGVAWLSGGEPGLVGAILGAALYGHAPSAAQIAAIRQTAAPLPRAPSAP